MRLADIGVAGGGVKVRGLVGDPAQEATDIRARFQNIEIRERRRQILVRDTGMDDTVTDRMNRDDLRTTPAFRNAVMPFHLSPQRPLAQPASPGVFSSDRPRL